MIHWTRVLGSLAMLLAASGCVSTYVPAAGEQMVNVRQVGYGTPQICKDGKIYNLPQADGSGAVAVPAGQRITMGAHMVVDGYQVMHFCRPFLSFVPVAGNRYLINSALSGEGRCSVELVREQPVSLTGLALEPSVDRPYCNLR